MNKTKVTRYNALAFLPLIFGIFSIWMNIIACKMLDIVVKYSLQASGDTVNDTRIKVVKYIMFFLILILPAICVILGRKIDFIRVPSASLSIASLLLIVACIIVTYLIPEKIGNVANVMPGAYFIFDLQRINSLDFEKWYVMHNIGTVITAVLSVLFSILNITRNKEEVFGIKKDSKEGTVTIESVDNEEAADTIEDIEAEEKIDIDTEE